LTSEAPQLALLRLLTEHEVAFVLVGGHAVAAHGYERATRDIDLVYATTAENGTRLAAALAAAGASVALADTPEPPGGITGEWLAEGGHFRFATQLAPLDALSALGGRGYDDLASRALIADLGEGLGVQVCSYEDLVSFKEQAGRPQDRVDLEHLRELRDEPPVDR
jgi:hypothetical protein